MNQLAPSELVLNPDGSIYHLGVTPPQIAHTIITVGDPARVPMVSKHFDTIQHQISKREFVTHTGFLNNKRISVVSTGIGPDNIDIVLNELDALVNINLQTRQIKENKTELCIIRLGTSGSMQPDIEPGDIVASRFAIGMDNLLYYYKRDITDQEAAFESTYYDYCSSIHLPVKSYFTIPEWPDINLPDDVKRGITLTCPGFYGPQSRTLRANAASPHLLDFLINFEFDGLKITNLEMESAAIFGLSNILGHRAISLNTILANRIKGTFVNDYRASVENLITKALQWIAG